MITAGAGLLVLFAALSAVAEPADRAERLAEIQQAFDPPVVRLRNEGRVVDASVLATLYGENTHQRQAAERWLTRRRAVILNNDQPGLTLRFAADGIEAMTLADRLYEGLPRRAESLQSLIDHAITQARQQRRPIRQLIIIGHAGLPGCAALGSTLDDCVFKGKLSAYQRRQLVRLRPYLADDAEIELRQCVTGSGKEGKRLLTALHQVTGATASSYLADFHFGDSANHPRIRVDRDSVQFIKPK